MKKTPLLPLMLASVTPAILTAAPNVGTSWTIKDSVEYEYFIEAQENRWVGFDPVVRAKPVLSPDGSRFFVVKVGAGLEQNYATYDLLIFDVTQTFRALRAGVAGSAPIVTSRKLSK